MIDAAATEPRTAGVSRSVIACILGNLFLRAASVGSGALVSVNLAAISREQQAIPATFVSLVAISFYATELVGSPFFGSRSDRGRPKTLMIAGSILGAFAIIFLAGANALNIFAGGLVAVALVVVPVRVLEGLSTATNVPSTLSYLGRETAGSERLRGRVLAWYEVASIVGVALGPLIATRLFDLSRPVSFLAMAAVYLISLAIFMFIRDPKPVAVGSGEHDIMKVFQVARSGRLMRFVPAWVAVNAILGLWFSHGLFLLTRTDDPTQFLDGGFSASVAGGVYAVFGLVFAVGVVIWGYAFGRISTTSIMLVATGGLLLQVAVLFALNTQSPEATSSIIGLLALAIVGAAIGAGFTPAALTYLSKVADEQGSNRGAVMGLYSVFFAGGQLLGGAIGGPFIDWAGGYGFLSATLLLVLIAGATVVLLARWEARNREA